MYMKIFGPGVPAHVGHFRWVRAPPVLSSTVAFCPATSPSLRRQTAQRCCCWRGGPGYAIAGMILAAAVARAVVVWVDDLRVVWRNSSMKKFRNEFTHVAFDIPSPSGRPQPSGLSFSFCRSFGLTRREPIGGFVAFLFVTVLLRHLRMVAAAIFVLRTVARWVVVLVIVPPLLPSLLPPPPPLASLPLPLPPLPSLRRLTSLVGAVIWTRRSSAFESALVDLFAVLLLPMAALTVLH